MSDAEKVLAELQEAVRDYRRSFPEPYALSPNLEIAAKLAVELRASEVKRAALEAAIETAKSWAEEAYDPYAHEGADSSQVLAILAEAGDPEALRKSNAEVVRKIAKWFHDRLPDGTGNGRAYNSHQVASVLREMADMAEEGTL